jgi:hypothetical protein
MQLFVASSLIMILLCSRRGGGAPPPEREEGDRERDRPPMDRGERSGGFDRERDREAGPSRPRGDFRDARGPPGGGPRDFDRGGPRDGDREPMRRGPPADEGPWRRGGDRDRDGERGGPRRMDGPGPGPRDGGRDGPGRGGGGGGGPAASGAWRRGGDDKGPGGRDFGRADDRDRRGGGPPRLVVIVLAINNSNVYAGRLKLRVVMRMSSLISSVKFKNFAFISTPDH